jgi:hypothetical protein
LPAKAIDNIGKPFQAGDVKALIEALEAIALYGVVGAHQGAPGPEAIIAAESEAQVGREGLAETDLILQRRFLQFRRLSAPPMPGVGSTARCVIS